MQRHVHGVTAEALVNPRARLDMGAADATYSATRCQDNFFRFLRGEKIHIIFACPN
ncbi:Hypothetical protein DEACI_1519 [Acididesulfobacillus acetoxydans]|uniref:Uncharacterized protein n=1 Tax=Acididesulfobacillus acetoxydans TaxID=1561005 RepID=A0A8S0XB76_9FIRM|nr:Hypothetical protein DEACI_1519 [Acididesulfobacillus acetoxydans]CEJ07215.1 Hypothetical protein DEACI_1673 [Acididesulfobacillus acetoxydans]